MVTEIATAFNTAHPSLNITTSKGRGMQADEIMERMQTDKFLNVLMGVDIEPESDVHRNTLGRVVEGRAMMYSFAKTDTAALDSLKTWWRTLCPGYGTGVLHNIQTQTTLGLVTFLRWRAIGGYQDTAAPFGNLWVADQLVEYTVYM